MSQALSRLGELPSCRYSPTSEAKLKQKGAAGLLEQKHLTKLLNYTLCDPPPVSLFRSTFLLRRSGK